VLSHRLQLIVNVLACRLYDGLAVLLLGRLLLDRLH
jgi:hypothetical protein